MRWWAPLFGLRRSERSRRQCCRSPPSCSPAAPRVGLSSCPSLQSLSTRSLPPVRCSCRPYSRQQRLRSRHFIGWLRGHAEQEFAGERGIIASGSEETTRSKRRRKRSGERELRPRCKTSPQMLCHPKSRLHVPSNLSLAPLPALSANLLIRFFGTMRRA